MIFFKDILLALGQSYDYDRVSEATLYKSYMYGVPKGTKPHNYGYSWLIMDIHNWFMDIHELIMDIHSSIMDMHNWIKNIHKSIMDIHN